MVRGGTFGEKFSRLFDLLLNKDISVADIFGETTGSR